VREGEKLTFRQGANAAQAFGHDAAGRGRNINANPLAWLNLLDGRLLLINIVEY